MFEVCGTSRDTGQPSWIGWENGYFYGPLGSLASLMVELGSEVTLPGLHLMASAADPVSAYATMLYLFDPAEDVIGEEPDYGDWPFDEITADVVMRDDEGEEGAKALVHVRPYLREGHPVAGYVRELPIDERGRWLPNPDLLREHFDQLVEAIRGLRPDTISRGYGDALQVGTATRVQRQRGGFEVSAGRRWREDRRTTDPVEAARWLIEETEQSKPRKARAWVKLPGPGEPDPTKTDAENLGALDNWFHDTYPSRLWMTWRWVKDADVEHAYRAMGQFHRMAQRYPWAINRLNSMALDPRPQSGGWSADTLASYDSKGRTIALRNQWWQRKNHEKFLHALQDSVFTNWHPHGCDTPESVMTHEFGHLVDDALDHDKRTWDAWRKFRKDSAHYSIPSNYAKTRQTEAIAEAFAEIHHAPMLPTGKLLTDAGSLKAGTRVMVEQIPGRITAGGGRAPAGLNIRPVEGLLVPDRVPLNTEIEYDGDHIRRPLSYLSEELEKWLKENAPR